MNCQKGDLAIVVGYEPHAGRIVKCISSFQYMGVDAWETSPRASSSEGYWDSDLRPIRDQPGEDETLTWAPVPHKETV